MQIFTCTISRLNGVHLFENTIKLSVSTPTIGKILEGNLTYLTMILPNYAKFGKGANLFQNMKKGVSCKQLVVTATGGKNTSSTPPITKCSPVKTKSAIKD